MLGLAAALALPGGQAALAAAAYEVTLPELEDAQLAGAIEDASNLLALQEEPPPGPTGLVRRARADVDRLRQVLRSLGYYEGTVSIALGGVPVGDAAVFDAVDEASEESPAQAEIGIEPGPRFTIGRLTLEQPEAPAVTIDRAELGVAPGDAASAQAVLSAQNRLVRQMREQGHPFAEVADRTAVVDYATDEMEVTYRLAPGPRADLGPVTFEGLEHVNRDFLQRVVPFDPGTPYRPGRVDDLRGDLSNLGVFRSVRVDPAPELTEDGELPLVVTVEERPRRVIGFGLSFATSEGIGARAYWGHRNLFGNAEELTINGEVGRIAENTGLDIERSLTFDFRKPHFRRRNQTLLAAAGYVFEAPDAFEREAFTASATLEREITPQLRVGAGLTFSAQTVEEDGEEEDFLLIGIPLSVTYDVTDNLLNPTEGYKVSLTTTPFPQALGSSLNMVRSQLTASAYYDFSDEGDTVLAGRVMVGSLFGPETSDVPADRRFYAGGGGSVRGYDFQSIGPQDASGDPLGGRSLFATSLELRQTIFGDVGLVGFVDGGNVYDTSVPDFDETLRFGAGIGVRYYTDFGPIRFDIGVPLNPENRSDQPPVSVYLSLGQAF
ncbi:MAG: BamA/TamA family outer membrane protein [Alphaproteobacteria bacterium]|nr:BamA/TamA family outer membrane protein [Alphaproteobacteria bacterium]